MKSEKEIKKELKVFEEVLEDGLPFDIPVALTTIKIKIRILKWVLK